MYREDEGNLPLPTEILEVGVDSYWRLYDDAHVMEVSCDNPNNDVYCLQGKS